VRSRILPALFTTAALAGVTLTVLACSDSETSNAPGDDADAASMPETSAPDANAGDRDAGAGLDATVPYDGAPAPVVCGVSPCVVHLVAGPSSYCGILDDGTVRCWGDPTLLARGDDAGAGNGPVTIDGVSGAVDLSMTSSQVCAVLADGGVDCWSADAPAPTQLADAPPAKRLALGASMSCAVATSGELDCWGDSFVFGSGPRTIDLAGRKAVDVAVSDSAAFVLDEDGVLKSWGKSGLLLGRATSIDVDLVARPVENLTKVRSFAMTSSHACAVSTGGVLSCWGDGDNAALGLGYSRDERYPVAVSFAAGDWPFQVASTDTHSCIRQTDGRVACWGGENPWGELGFATKTSVYVPSKVTGLPVDAVAMAVGLSSSCTLTKEGAVWCWGDNRRGQLGRGQPDSLRHWDPAKVVFP
jgi:alpha-tubulin suppressor-like RCC1 family protein